MTPKEQRRFDHLYDLMLRPETRCRPRVQTAASRHGTDSALQHFRDEAGRAAGFHRILPDTSTSAKVVLDIGGGIGSPDSSLPSRY